MDLFFNITIMALLLVTIVYAIRLNGKLNLIRENKLEIKANIDAFYSATDKASKAISDLQKQGRDLCREIDEKISKARQSSDEIEFMLKRVKRTTLTLEESMERDKPVSIEPSLAFTAAQRQAEIQPNRELSRERQIEERLRAAKAFANSQPVQKPKAETRYGENFVSLSEQDLLKAMRDREFKQALMG